MKRIYKGALTLLLLASLALTGCDPELPETPDNTGNQTNTEQTSSEETTSETDDKDSDTESESSSDKTSDSSTTKTDDKESNTDTENTKDTTSDNNSSSENKTDKNTDTESNSDNKDTSDTTKNDNTTDNSTEKTSDDSDTNKTNDKTTDENQNASDNSSSENTKTDASTNNSDDDNLNQDESDKNTDNSTDNTEENNTTDNNSNNESENKKDTTDNTNGDANNESGNQNTTSDDPYAKLTSLQMAAEMKIGWNLGNTLDAPTETGWGMPKTTQAMIDAVRDAGFKTIRIPVSWSTHVSGSDYTIDSSWINRVQEIVDWAINDDLIVIINVHHDNYSEVTLASQKGGYALSDNSDTQKKSKAYLESVWKQIATKFASYNDQLVFEVLNEPRDIDGEWYGNEWWTNNKTMIDLITTYEQTCIDTIRSVAGNENRFIMTPGYAASGSDSSMLSLYTMPTDTATDKLMLSAHAYSPYDFAMNNMDDTTFDSSDAASLTSIFNYLKTNYIKKGIGVVIGEASASDKNNTDERIKWAKDYFNKAALLGIPVVLWDNMVLYPSDNPAENHGWLNRNTCTWYFPTIIDAMMEVVNNPVDNTTASDGNLLSEDLVLSSWSVNTTISSGSFDDAKDSSKLVITYEKIEDYSDVCVKLQAGDWSSIFTQGEIDGGSIGTEVLYPSSTSGTITYTPTSEEWSTIRSKGLVVYGYGLKITKIIIK